MGYRLRPSESVPAGLRRVVRNEIDAAISEMSNAGIDRHEAIHEARKRLKKVRAVLRLIRPVAPEIFDAENPFYRDLGRGFSAVRDATTAIEAIDALAERFKDDMQSKGVIARTRELFIARRERIADQSANLNRAAKLFVTGLRKARERVAEWPLPRRGFNTIAPGLKLSYAQGKASLAAARDEPTPENLHELRKRTKDHWYQTRLLECIWPDLMACHRDSLARLSDLLGEDHDLTIVRETMLVEPDLFAPEENLRPLTDLVGRRQEELRAQAFPLARRIYAEKPKSLRNRFDAYWNAMKEDVNSDKTATQRQIQSAPAPKL